MADQSCAGIVYGGPKKGCWLRAAINVQFCEKGSATTQYNTYTNGKDPFKWIADLERSGGKVVLDAKTYYIDRQYTLPPGSSLSGAGQGKTVIQAVRWLGADGSSICGTNAKHRIGIVVGDNTYIGKFTYTGVDTSRPSDNGELCAGNAIEFPGCNQPYCDSHAYTGNGDGHGASHVVVEDIEFTAYTVQNMVFMAQTDAGKRVSSDVQIRRLSTLGTWADGLNIHGAHRDIVVEDCSAFNTGDDCFALWDSSIEGQFAQNVTFTGNKAGNPHFNGNDRDCFSQFGGRSANYINNQCDNPTNAMIHYWIAFCGSGQAGSPGKSVCYPSDAVSTVRGNTLTHGTTHVLKDDPKQLPGFSGREGGVGGLRARAEAKEWSRRLRQKAGSARVRQANQAEHEGHAQRYRLGGSARHSRRRRSPWSPCRPGHWSPLKGPGKGGLE
jgi:hypothetical protein